MERILRLAQADPRIIASTVLSESKRSMSVSLPRLESDRLILRMATREDAPAILAYYLENKEFLRVVEPSRSDRFYTLEFWQEQISTALLEYGYEHSLRFCLFQKEAPHVVMGQVNFNQIYRGVFHSCFLGYSLAEKHQGQGYMTEALTVAIDYMFAEVNLHRIAANYMPRNQRSGNVLRRLGFVVEGYARDYLRINGRWEDHILTSLTNPHWIEMPDYM